MARLPHTATAKGRMVKVTLLTGEIFYARFMDRTKNKRVIFDTRTVRAGDIKSFVASHALSHGNQRRD